MHEISMHDIEITMHENEHFAQISSWVRNPCMKLGIAQLPMQTFFLRVNTHYQTS